MKYRIFILLSLIFLSCSSTQKTPTSPSKDGRYGPWAIPLSLDHQFFQKEGQGEKFWKMIGHYKFQQTDSSCSLASTTLVMNSIRPSSLVPEDDELYTEEKILKIAGSNKWKSATRNKSTGMKLLELENEVKKLIINGKMSNQYKVQAVEMKNKNDEALFRTQLEKFENNSDWLILMFGQGEVLGGKEPYPHYSPVGAYDKKTDRVLIIDVDGKWYEPYWLPVEVLLKSLLTFDLEMKSHRGFVVISEI